MKNTSAKLIVLIIASFFVSGCTHQLPENLPLAQISEVESAPEENIIKPESLRIPILVYHSVRPAGSRETYSITPEAFERQLQHLQENGYVSVTMADLDDFLNGKKVAPPKPVILNFDDGVDSQYTYAWPLLKKYNIKATFFLYSNPINRKNFMTTDQIKELIVGGMEIGAHTRYHAYLTKTTDEEEMEQEVDLSRKKLEEMLGISINIFAYPFGLSDERVQKIVKDYGYILARGLRHDPIISEEDRYDLNGFIVTENFNSFLKILE